MTKHLVKKFDAEHKSGLRFYISLKMRIRISFVRLCTKNMGIKDTFHPNNILETVKNAEFHGDFKSAHRFLFGCVFPEIYQFF